MPRDETQQEKFIRKGGNKKIAISNDVAKQGDNLAATTRMLPELGGDPEIKKSNKEEMQ